MTVLVTLESFAKIHSNFSKINCKSSVCLFPNILRKYGYINLILILVLEYTHTSFPKTNHLLILNCNDYFLEQILFNLLFFVPYFILEFINLETQ